ncbi:MAG: hypothetical protein KatS3mg110_3338 [Pirellulaceae bacterium]|nr:MAG: hypothetical protein KatS3mg110_3338 [Pirellulaceae bacterium]
MPCPNHWLAVLASCVGYAAVAPLLAQTGQAPMIDPQVTARYGDWAQPWRTSRLRGTPEPPPPLAPSRVFPRIAFRNPTVLTLAPQTRRFFVAEQMGKIYSFRRDPEVAAADLFLDTTQLLARWPEGEQLQYEGLYGLVFDPGYPERPYCYVCYVARYREAQRGQHPRGTRVSRFTVIPGDPPRADPESELVIIEWLQGGHNGGCLKFGSDGCLYISTGDGGPAYPPDPLRAGQDVSNLLSAILRLDVRDATPQQPYRVPAGNPFVDLPGARPEIWAYGLRNPWKMSFDRLTGELWVGDVGWELWELVFRVRPGDNFGWSLVEGPQVVHTDRPAGPTPIVPPVMAISHVDGASITGGYVYRGRKFPEFYGMYIFGDWETRRIWAIRFKDGEVTPLREIAEPTVRVVDFAEDEDGELYVLDYDEGTIHELVRNPAAISPAPFPTQLSQTGLFRSVPDQQPEAGVVPFLINAPLWSDHARADRWLAVPDGQPVEVFAQPQPVPGSMFTRSLVFPKHSVLVKTYWMLMREGDPSSRRNLETQVLYFDGRFWHGFSYWWNESGTDAELVPAEGLETWLTIEDPRAPGGRRRQLWRVPSRQECIRCHNPWSEYALAFCLPQLNRSVFAGGSQVPQLRMLAEIGRLRFRDIPEAPFGRLASETEDSMRPWWERLPRLADPFDSSWPLEARARAYLHANCAHCHRFGGGGSAYLHLVYDLPLSECRAVDVPPSQGTFGVAQARLIAPGAPERSVLLYRMATCGAGRMPRIGSYEVDVQGLELIESWIAQMAGSTGGRDDAHRANGLPLDEQELESYFAATDRAWLLMRRLDRNPVPGDLLEPILERASKAEPAIRDLFERFQPAERRTRRVGDTVPVERVLKMPGDPQRGRMLFEQSAELQCRRCHGVGEPLEKVGPDLAGIGAKRSRRELLESLVDPSRNIDPKYLTWLLELDDGRVLTGRLVDKTATHYRLKTANNEELSVEIAHVAHAQTQRVSLMPDGQLRDLTVEQLADLLAYLESLKGDTSPP